MLRLSSLTGYLKICNDCQTTAPRSPRSCVGFAPLLLFEVPQRRESRPSNKQKASSILRASQAVPHPSTNRALRRLTSEVRRDPVHSTRYGRQRVPTPPSRSLKPPPTATTTEGARWAGAVVGLVLRAAMRTQIGISNLPKIMTAGAGGERGSGGDRWVVYVWCVFVCVGGGGGTRCRIRKTNETK